jgi:hypothetical protein
VPAHETLGPHASPSLPRYGRLVLVQYAGRAWATSRPRWPPPTSGATSASLARATSASLARATSASLARATSASLARATSASLARATSASLARATSASLARATSALRLFQPRTAQSRQSRWGRLRRVRHAVPPRRAPLHMLPQRAAPADSTPPILSARIGKEGKAAYRLLLMRMLLDEPRCSSTHMLLCERLPPHPSLPSPLPCPPPPIYRKST